MFVEGFGGIGGMLRFKVEVDVEAATKIGEVGDFDPEEDFI